MPALIPSGFVLVTADSSITKATEGHALRITEHRLRKALWPIFEKTRNRTAITAGSRLLFYVGGAHEAAGTIVASATVARKSVWSAARGAIDPPLVAFEVPSQALALTDIGRIVPPVRFRDILPSLSFAPTNDQKWGAVLMGGCRALYEADWKVLTGALEAGGTR